MDELPANITVVKIDVRIPRDMKAATTITTGKNDTKAFAANATAAVDELDLELRIPGRPTIVA